ncbi:MAG TPA: hypothetical protein VF138_12615 [Caulobacteraceae bacterium]
MDQSRRLAGILGPTLAAVGVSLLINHGLLAQLMLSLAANPEAILMLGIATLATGLAIVINHNVWRGWPIVLTLFGWNAVFSGLYRVIFPGHIAAYAPILVNTGWALPAAAAILLVLGLFLSWKAFRA